MKQILIASVLIAAAPIFAADMDEHTKRIHEAGVVLGEIMDAGDHSIPGDLLRKASCVGVVPNLKRAGFIVGGKYGKGVITCRNAEGVGWSAPATIRIEGGSIGFQIGVGETDLVFVVMNRSGEDKLMKDKFTFGGDASVMAGPVGRSGNAETDAAMKAEILAYSRSRGVFAGVSLEGATMRSDNDDNAKIYGKPVTMREILHGDVRPPESASSLYSVLNRYAPLKG